MSQWLPSPQSLYYVAYPSVLALGWAITWVNTQRTERMKGDMARVNEQLKEFYGPLQMISAATHASYEAMIQQFLEQPQERLLVDSAAATPSKATLTAEGVGVHRPQPSLPLRAAVDEARERLDQQRKAWHAALLACTREAMSPAAQHYRLWATEVLQPLNERALEILIRRADLMDTAMVPPVFRQLAAHVLAFRTLLERWKKDDFSHMRCTVKFPDALGPYVGAEFGRLKLRQAEQLNTLHTVRLGSSLQPEPVEMKVSAGWGPDGVPGVTGLEESRFVSSRL